MEVVQQVLKDGMINYLNTVMKKARVFINDKWVDYPIHNTTIIDNVIWKYIYLDTEEGYVKDAHLLSENNEILAAKNFTIHREEDGIALVFKFTLNIKEG